MKVTVCAVGLFYNLSVGRMLCFFRIVVLFLCVVFVRLSLPCKFFVLISFVFLYFFLFEVYKSNREKDNKKTKKFKSSLLHRLGENTYRKRRVPVVLSDARWAFLSTLDESIAETIKSLTIPHPPWIPLCHSSSVRDELQFSMTLLLC